MAGILSVDSIWKLGAELHIIKHLSTIFQRRCEGHVNRFYGTLKTKVQGASAATGPRPNRRAAHLGAPLLPDDKKFAIMEGFPVR